MPRKRSILEILREVRRKANFETAEFGHVVLGRDTLPKREQDVTKFIRDRTHLYRQTWVNPLIDELIAREERRQQARNRPHPTKVKWARARAGMQASTCGRCEVWHDAAEDTWNARSLGKTKYRAGTRREAKRWCEERVAAAAARTGSADGPDH